MQPSAEIVHSGNVHFPRALNTIETSGHLLSGLMAYEPDYVEQADSEQECTPL